MKPAARTVLAFLTSFLAVLSACDNGWDDLGNGVERRLLGFGDPGSRLGDAHYADLAVHITSEDDPSIRCGAAFEYRVGAETPCAFGTTHWQALVEGDSVQFRVFPDGLHCAFLDEALRGCPLDSAKKLLLTVAVRAVYDSSNYTDSPRYQRLVRHAMEAELIQDAIEREGFKELAFEWMEVWHVVQDSGQGVPPRQGEEVAIAYTGRFLDGRIFDDASDSLTWLYYPYGKPDQVVRGFELAISRMAPGERRTIWLTSDLAFGERGSKGIVPPNTPVVYDLQLMKVLRSDSSAVHNPS